MSTIPEEFKCPISMDLMTDPVMGSDGQTYERRAIQEWLQNHRTSPMTRQPMDVTSLKPNFALRSAIERWKTQNPDILPIPPTQPLPPTPDKAFTVKCRKMQEHMVLEVDTVTAEPMETVLIAVLDVSGSMDSTSNPKGTGQEGMAFSRLDLVKHSMTTLATLLHSQRHKTPSSLSIITFADVGKLAMPLTRMDDTGLAQAKTTLASLKTEGSTNLWDGLRVGLDQAAQAASKSPNATIQLLVLTDGEPTAEMLPPLGLKSTLKRRLDRIEARINISTFGFGYNLDCDLLEEICQQGGGSYGFIPDCSMVGTVFINWCAKALLTRAHHVSLQLSSSTYPLGDLLVGRPLTLTLPKEPITQVKIEYDNRKTATVNVEEEPGTIDKELFTMEFLKVLGEIKSYKQQQLIPVRHLEQLWQKYSQGANCAFIEDGLADIRSENESEGQIGKAISRADWYKTWGRSHCIAYTRALQLQQCVNFKDKLLQHFASPAFKELQDDGIDIFSSLPAPTPRVSMFYNAPNPTASVSSFSPSADMSRYVSAAGPCFLGRSTVLMDNTRLKFVSELKKGDKVWGGHKVRCVLYTPVFDYVDMCEMDTGLFITPWHPLQDPKTGEWVFPNQLVEPQRMYVEAYYNLVLETGHVVELNAYPVCTLGHGFTNNDVITHPYFGTMAVVYDLMSREGWEEGLIVIDRKDTIRSEKTGLVTSI